MSDTPTPDIAALRELITRAHDHVCDLAEGKAKWTMRTPADESRDSDLVISAGLGAGQAALDRLATAEQETAEARARLEGSREFINGERTRQRVALDAARAETAEARAELDAVKKNRLISAIFGHHRNAPKPFALYRREDETGVSGTGVVALGAEFPDGMVVLRWTSAFPTSVVFHERGIESVEAIHGHGGKTQVVWLSDELETLAEAEQKIEALSAEVATLREQHDKARAEVAEEIAKAIEAIEVGDPWTRNEAALTARDHVVPDDAEVLLREATPAPAAEGEADDEAIHGWFGLTYSNYLVLPRTLLQSMPGRWQTPFVALLEQLRAAYAHIERAEAYHVEAGKWCYPSDLTDDEMLSLGYSRPDAPDGDDEDAELPDVWYGPDGEEHDGHSASVFVPGKDPVPHYNRGRTRIEPAVPAAADT